MLPLLLGVDVVTNILDKKYVRISSVGVILWCTALCMVVVLTKYGDGFVMMDAELFTAMSVGWWVLFVCSGVAVVEIVVGVYVLDLHKFKFLRLHMVVLNAAISFGLVVSVSLVLIDADACVTGEPLSGDIFCQYRLTYVLVGLACVLSYEMQTLAS